MTISKDLVAASATALILSLLKEGESYGYAIIKKVKGLSDGEILWSEGMLYPVLHRLEGLEYIESFWKESGSGRKRKYYRIRADGLEALARQKQQWELVNKTLRKVWKSIPERRRLAGEGILCLI
jgi:DNA-binding PadR family transcriptional regulator